MSDLIEKWRAELDHGASSKRVVMRDMLAEIEFLNALLEGYRKEVRGYREEVNRLRKSIDLVMDHDSNLIDYLKEAAPEEDT